MALLAVFKTSCCPRRDIVPCNVFAQPDHAVVSRPLRIFGMPVDGMRMTCTCSQRPSTSGEHA